MHWLLCIYIFYTDYFFCVWYFCIFFWLFPGGDLKWLLNILLFLWCLWKTSSWNLKHNPFKMALIPFFILYYYDIHVLSKRFSLVHLYLVFYSVIKHKNKNSYSSHTVCVENDLQNSINFLVHVYSCKSFFTHIVQVTKYKI